MMVFNGVISLNNCYLKAVNANDLEFMRKNRNNKDITRFLRPIPDISKESQLEWYNSQISSPDSYSFSLFDGSEIVGNSAIYNIKDDEAEFGRILISPNHNGKGYGYTATILSLYFAFNYLRVNKVVATVNIKNDVAIHLYKKVGFSFIDTFRHEWGAEEYNIVIDQNTFKKCNPDCSKIEIK